MVVGDHKISSCSVTGGLHVNTLQECSKEHICHQQEQGDKKGITDRHTDREQRSDPCVSLHTQVIQKWGRNKTQPNPDTINMDTYDTYMPPLNGTYQ